MLGSTHPLSLATLENYYYCCLVGCLKKGLKLVVLQIPPKDHEMGKLAKWLIMNQNIVNKKRTCSLRYDFKVVISHVT